MKWMFIALAVLLALAVGALAAGWLFERRAEARDTARRHPPGRLVDLGQGRRLHIVCQGEGPAPTVVLEAGGANPAALAGPLQARIAGFARVCAYDRAGLGWSDPAAPGRSFEDRAADLDALLIRTGAPAPYVLVGESLGGLVVRTYARLHPEKVAGLVLVDSAEEESVFAFFTPAFLERMRQGARRTETLAGLGLVRLAAPRKAAEQLASYPPAVREEMVARMSRPAFWRAVADEASAYEMTPPARRAAGGFGALGSRPLVVIRHGKPFTGEMAGIEPGWAAAQARLAALSSDSRLVVAEGAGHGIAQEKPDLVAAAVREVVEKVRGVTP